MQSQKSKVTAGDVDIRPFLIEDLKPFVSLSHRDQLSDRFAIIQSELAGILSA